MPNLPSGTVTFLFTDIQGSTQLWEQHPEAMRDALARHDELLRKAIEDNNGVVFKTVGDAFCAAFATASDALRAALSSHLILLNEDWGETGPLRVRVALHTGEAQERDGDYFGQTLNRVARLQAVGHGQQTLLSQTTYQLVCRLLPRYVTLQNMGRHRLKDLLSPEHIWQVLHPDLPSEFPSLRSLDNLPNNLPRQITSFVGRSHEMQEVKRLLSSAPLLTLLGMGGSGKTRLALQVGAEVLDDYKDGVWLVELAALSDPNLVPQPVASVLGLREEAGRPLLQTIQDYLRDQHLLLILDNCEHLVVACAHLADTLLKTCPRLTILATSREPLDIAGEHPWRLPSLSTLSPTDLPLEKKDIVVVLMEHDACRLFVERAVVQRQDFVVTNQNAPAIASICHRLDGIPLALELAAARVRSLSVEEINLHLNNRFHLLTGGSRIALPHQKTLRALIDWSYDLLNVQEKTLLCRLSVFAGGWTLQAAEQVGSGESATGESLEDWEVLDLLTSLVDKSLAVAQTQGETMRYRLLETVRQYAHDRLVESGESPVVRARHSDCFLMLAEENKPKLRGAEQAQWLGILEEEHDNLRQALTLYAEDAEAGEKGLRLGAALQHFWRIRGHLSEGRERSSILLAHPGGQEPTAARAEALNGAGVLADLDGDNAQASVLYEESLAMARELKHKIGIAAALGNLGNVARAKGDDVQAHSLYWESLAIECGTGNKWGIATALGNLATIAYSQGDYAMARAVCRVSLAVFRELGDKGEIAISLNHLGNVAQKQGDDAVARSAWEESLAIARELENKRGIATALNGLGHMAGKQGNYAVARAQYEESLSIAHEARDKIGIATALNNLGNMPREKGDDAQARLLYEESLAIFRKLGDKGSIATVLGNLGIVAQKQGDDAVARSAWEESLAIARELENKRGIATALNNLGNVTQKQGDDAQARLLYEESLAVFRELGDRQGIAFSLEAFAFFAFKEAYEERCARLLGATTALHESIGSPLLTADGEKPEHRAAVMLKRLSEDAFAAAWASGRAMTLEQAIEYALENDSS